jgi:MFS family permease
MPGWFRGLSVEERRVFWACFAGWALDGMDVQIYSFVMPSLLGLWKLSNSEAGMLGTAALLFSALGGWLAGMLSDRFGRVRVLQVTIVWYALFTFLSGLTNSFWQLLAVRAVQGLGFGGEWAAGSVLMGEVIEARHRGKAVGVVQGGWAIGWGAGAIAYTIVFSLLPSEWAWRVMFFLGISPALLVIYIQRYVSEPPVFEATRREVAARNERVNFLEIFSPPLVLTTLFAALLVTGAMGGYYALTIWLPTYLKTVRHLSVFNTGAYLAVIIVGSALGYFCAAYLTDGIGRRRTFFLFAVGSALIVLLYTYLPIANGTMLVLGLPLGFFASGIFSGMGPFLTELFPSRVRGSGQGFSYNFGRGIGALFPALVGSLSAWMPLGQAIGVFAIGAYALLILAALPLPETRGKRLEAYN